MADLANNENRDFTAEERQSWELVNANYDKLTCSIELAERVEEVDADQQAPT